MTSPVEPTGRRPRRTWSSSTSLVTAAAIAGVLLAGTAAVAANIGILNAADSSVIGDLAASDDLLPAPSETTNVTDTSLATTSTSTTTTTEAIGVAQQYDIAEAGSVWVLATRSGVALDHVAERSGWTSSLTQSEARSLQVEFANLDRVIVFRATLGTDGSIVVDVTEPTTVVGSTPAAAPRPIETTPTVATTHHDDDHDDDFDDDHDDDFDDDFDDDHDDDDHDEYEGADDDD